MSKQFRKFRQFRNFDIFRWFAKLVLTVSHTLFAKPPSFGKQSYLRPPSIVSPLLFDSVDDFKRFPAGLPFGLCLSGSKTWLDSTNRNKKIRLMVEYRPNLGRIFIICNSAYIQPWILAELYPVYFICGFKWKW